MLIIVENDTLEFIHRKKQFNTGIQALIFSKDGKVMFSSAGQKEVCVSAIQVEGRDIMSVEFGGFSDNAKSEEESNGGNDTGGDLRIMGIDVRDELLDGVSGYLVALALSDSTVKVSIQVDVANCSYTGLIRLLRNVFRLLRASILLVVS